MDTKLKTEIRGFLISKFRNIGFTTSHFKGEETDQSEGEQFILNYSLNKELMGDLVILIGPNNSGKSNILDALECFAKEKITNRDKSDTFTNDDERKPTLSLVGLTSNKQETKWKWSTNYKYVLNSDNTLQYTNEKGETSSQPSFDLNKYAEEINQNNYRNFTNFVVFINQFIHQHNLYDANDNSMNSIVEVGENGWNFPKNDLAKLREAVIASFKFIISLQNNEEMTDEYETLIDNLRKNNWIKIDNFLKQYNDYEIDMQNHGWCKQDYPKIIRYDEENIKDADLSCAINEIDNSSFFTSLFQILDNGTQQIKNVYQTYHENESMSILYAKSNKYTSNLLKISDYFNNLYCLDNNVYKFELRLEKDTVNFVILKESESNPNNPIGLTLNYQSTGFKWFFNFFFNVFASKKLVCGDIVLMDEPATNLHVKGQEELRKFLKKFAIDNGVTFVIATHSPFLVDLDYLDEVRLISIKADNTSKIDDDFTTVNPDDADSLLPIRESLTTRNSVLLDPNQIVVFVEGEIDYNYLAGMRNLFREFKNLTFLPINGVGSNKEEFKKKLKQLKKIKKYKCIVFTDGDKNGNDFKEISKSFKTVSTSDLNEEYNTIENLFDEEDVKKFNLFDDAKGKWNKSQSISVTFKKILMTHPEEVSDKTKSNFYQMLNLIKNKIKSRKLNEKKQSTKKQAIQ